MDSVHGRRSGLGSWAPLLDSGDPDHQPRDGAKRRRRADLDDQRRHDGDAPARPIRRVPALSVGRSCRSSMSALHGQPLCRPSLCWPRARCAPTDRLPRVDKPSIAPRWAAPARRPTASHTPSNVLSRADDRVPVSPRQRFDEDATTRSIPGHDRAVLAPPVRCDRSGDTRMRGEGQAQTRCSRRSELEG